MGFTYRSKSQSLLKNVSTMALYEELIKRKEVKYIKDKDTYVITINKKDVEI